MARIKVEIEKKQDGLQGGERMNEMKKILKIVGIIGIIIVILGVGGFYFYVSDYYHASESAMLLLEQSDVTKEEGYYVVNANEEEVGFIFYPGGKVDELAYLPLLEDLKNEGITSYLVTMPFHLAVFDANAADQIINAHPEVKAWYIGGHSLGGAMASQYASEHPEIAGLVLLGAYPYGDVSQVDTLIIYGSQDEVLDRSKLNGQDSTIVIEGGNHAQFGDYGVQAGDGTATISADEQQRVSAQYIADFIKATSK